MENGKINGFLYSKKRRKIKIKQNKKKWWKRNRFWGQLINKSFGGM